MRNSEFCMSFILDVHVHTQLYIFSRVLENHRMTGSSENQYFDILHFIPLLKTELQSALLKAVAQWKTFASWLYYDLQPMGDYTNPLDVFNISLPDWSSCSTCVSTRTGEKTGPIYAAAGRPALHRSWRTLPADEATPVHRQILLGADHRSLVCS